MFTLSFLPTYYPAGVNHKDMVHGRIAIGIWWHRAFFKKNFHKQKNAVHLQPQRVGAIAQLVEQRTENPCVAGSIPAGTTKKVTFIM
jgi:hypothetical protein